MYRNISHLPLYFPKSSFQFSYCTIFSTVSFLWQQLDVELHGACQFFCLKMVPGGHVCKLQLCDCTRGGQLAHVTMPSGQLCSWACPPVPGSCVLILVRRLGAAVLPLSWGRDLAQQELRWAGLSVPFTRSLSCFTASGSTYCPIIPTITGIRVKGGPKGFAC